MTLELRFSCGTLALRMEKASQLRFVFVRHCDIVAFFDDVRILLYFGTLALRMEITLQLSLVELRYILLRKKIKLQLHLVFSSL